MRVTVVLKEGYYDDPDGGWIPAVTAEGELVSVMWHPIDGPTGAVLMPWGEFEYYKMEKIEAIDQ